MYRNLPRHTFGFIQGKLFPKYFQLGTILSSVTLATYVVQNPFGEWDTRQMIQVCTTDAKGPHVKESLHADLWLSKMQV